MELTPGQWVFLFAALVFASFAFSYHMRRTGPEALRHRLRKIVIPEFILDNATVTTALERLGELSVRHDPKSMGVPFTTTAHTDETVSLTLERQPLWDTLEAIALLYSLYYHLDEEHNGVELFLPTGDEPLMIRRYKPSGDRFPRPWTIDFEADFRGVGLDLQPEGYANYEDNVLTVKAPENTLNLLEKMFGLDPLEL